MNREETIERVRQRLLHGEAFGTDESLGREERAALFGRIVAEFQRQDAVLVAHYYTAADIQEVADATGGIVSDSLEMARFGYRHPASTVIVAGVRFMGETAKILSPEKRVLMPTAEATCSLDLGCPADAFGRFCDEHPDRTVVVYANTSAAVKARADWVVTSSIAVDVVRHLHERGEKILWAPDKYLGDYVRRQTGADIVAWDGACIVHQEFKAVELERLRAAHPDAKVLVHPESPPGVIAQADVVGSTTQLLKAVSALDAETFIVATDNGLFHKMHEAEPGKRFLEAPTAGKGATCSSCAHCPWMAMNGLRNLYAALTGGGDEIVVDPAIGRRALVSLNRMVGFGERQGRDVAGTGDA